MMRTIDGVTVTIQDDCDPAIKEQMVVFWKALEIYAKRNVEYKDNWKRMGWRGMLIRVRERAERLWDSLWDQTPWDDIDGEEAEYMELQKKLDDAYDGINFLGFLARAVEDGNRDGAWW